MLEKVTRKSNKITERHNCMQWSLQVPLLKVPLHAYHTTLVVVILNSVLALFYFFQIFSHFSIPCLKINSHVVNFLI